MRSAADHRHQRHAALAHVLDRRQVAALGVGVVAVDVAAEDQAALVGLADVEMPGAEGDDAGRSAASAPSDDEGLQHVALDRQPQARHRGDARGVAGDRHADLAGADRRRASSRRRSTRPPRSRMPVTSQFWMMSTPRALGAARIAPGDRVVARRAAAPLQQPALDREARIVEIEERQPARARCSRSSSSASTPCSRMALPRRAIGVALRVGMVEVQHAALADHGVVVELLLEPFPELHRHLVEGMLPGSR